jgi:aspartate kinase
MEERKVNAIAHKDNILRYRLAPDTGVLQLLEKWHYEIYKINLYEAALELYIEEKYESELDYMLQESGIPTPEKSRDIGFVNLVGLGLATDPAFMAKVLRLCANSHLQRISHSCRTLELMLPAVQVAKTIALLHQEFFGVNG